ncbi:murein hydrolase activator EnvC family protein [Anaeroselena agilis]|uniref:Peptidoglycan DD-metalloendopeptidase family protein n=1 Tax=Anaeroselena agilis TaxID=3063788 RepID=A0ABU3P5J9_9FIRM|nr:peptidoglycan DD-metalloendopeptidase family protein [Selenomonadales bacterium 4137-cl]
MDKRRITALALALLLTSAAALPALANEIEDHQRQLQDIQQQMQLHQQKAAEAQQKVTSVAEQLRLIQTDLDAALDDYNAIQSRRAYTEQQIVLNKEILAKAEKSLAERTKILNKRIRDIYKNGQVSYLDVLLGATDFRDFTTRADLLKRVLAQDAALITKVRLERELVTRKKAELERDRLAIIELEKVALAKKRLIEGRRNEREQVLNSAVNERDTAERAYQELQETSRRIEQMIRNIQSGGQDASGATGTLIWPATGPITSPFGWRTHPIFGTQRYHSGIDIGADYGEPIRAADGGVVIYADWMGGYGKAVIIDHGGSISTLYGHSSELLVGEGQRVYKGQVIARVGSTGYSTGPHLHFEVRQNGSPVSPLGYLP